MVLNMEWISRYDKFPDYSGWYLVYSARSKKISISFFTDLDNQFHRIGYGGKNVEFKSVSHWMYLPEPPKQ